MILRFEVRLLSPPGCNPANLPVDFLPWGVLHTHIVIMNASIYLLIRSAKDLDGIFKRQYSIYIYR